MRGLTDAASYSGIRIYLRAMALGKGEHDWEAVYPIIATVPVALVA
jgi:hypothetical protein